MIPGWWLDPPLGFLVTCGRLPIGRPVLLSPGRDGLLSPCGTVRLASSEVGGYISGLESNIRRNLISSGFFNGLRGRLRRPSVAFKSVLCKCARDSVISFSITLRSAISHAAAFVESSSFSGGLMADHFSTQEVPALSIS